MSTSAMGVWMAAAALYVAFRLWYDGWRGPLSPREVDSLVGRLAEQPGATPEGLATLRRFLGEDDGREFVMVNLVRLHPEAQPHPDGGAPTRARTLLAAYTRPFIKALMRRAGHPAFVGPVAGGHIDSWNVTPDPGWSLVGLMRYRSRRDLAELATSALFSEVHPFKYAAIESTFSVPTARARLFFGPRVWVALLLALAAALAT